MTDMSKPMNKIDEALDSLRDNPEKWECTLGSLLTKGNDSGEFMLFFGWWEFYPKSAERDRGIRLNFWQRRRLKTILKKRRK